MRKATIVLSLCAASAMLLAPYAVFAASKATPAPNYVELRDVDFQKEIDGKQVGLYTIKNKKGMVVKITNYGARVEQILVPDRAGKLGDVAQGYETIDQVLGGQGSMGAFIGRYANRIANGTFSLDGTEYKLAINDLSTPPAPPRRTPRDRSGGCARRSASTRATSWASWTLSGSRRCEASCGSSTATPRWRSAII